MSYVHVVLWSSHPLESSPFCCWKIAEVLQGAAEKVNKNKSEALNLLSQSGCALSENHDCSFGKVQGEVRALSMAPKRGKKKPLAVSPFDMTNKGKCVKVLEPHCRAGRGKQMAPHHMPVIPIKMHSNSFLFSSASLFHTSEQACLTTECGNF